MAEMVNTMMERVRRFLGQDLWTWSGEQRGLTNVVMRLLQLVVMLAEGFAKDNLLLRASALTYVTSLSLIPLLAVALSFVRLFDPSNNLATIAVEYLAAGAPEAQEKILELVGNANIAGLGTIGAIILFLSTILALRHLEATLNTIWGLRRDRSWGRRFADYLAVIVVVPMLMGAAVSLGATLSADAGVAWLLKLPVFAPLFELGLHHLPKAILLIGFTFTYWFFPNTKVDLGAALLGGALSALLFTIAQEAYLGLNIGVARYSALFGGFAALPLLLAWIYVCWCIVMLGAELSFAYQNLESYRLEVRGRALGSAERESLGFCVALDVARAFRDRGPLSTAAGLSEELHISIRAIREIIEVLEKAGILIACTDEHGTDGYQLARPAEKISVCDVRNALRGAHPALLEVGGGATRDAVAKLTLTMEAAVNQSAGGQTFDQLLEHLPEGS